MPNETIQPLTKNPAALAALLEAVREAVENARPACYQDPALRRSAVALSQVIIRRLSQ